MLFRDCVRDCVCAYVCCVCAHVSECVYVFVCVCEPCSVIDRCALEKGLGWKPCMSGSE